MAGGAPTVFQYTSAQRFLQDWFLWKKTNSHGISLQSISRKLGLTSRSHLHRILHSPSFPISIALAQRFESILELSTRENEYWEALVAFSKAVTLESKNVAFARMDKIRVPRKERIRSMEYFSRWYLPVLRELAAMCPSSSPRELATHTLPPITESEARTALESLVKLNLLVNGAPGQYRQNDAVVESGDDLDDYALQNFQCAMSRLGTSAIANMPRQEREAETLTFSIPESYLPEIRSAMRRMRDELIRVILAAPGNADRVYHINVQCFPVSRKRSRIPGGNTP